MMNRRSALKTVLAAAAGLFAGFLRRGNAGCVRPLLTNQLCGSVGAGGKLAVRPYRSLEDVLRTPGLRISGGSVFFAPGESPYAALAAAVPPVDPGYERAHFKAGVAPDGGQLLWRVFDVPLA